EKGRVAVAGVPDRSLSYGDVIRRGRHGGILGQGTFVASKTMDGSEVVMDLETGQGYGSAEWHPAVAACEVEVDLETGKTRVLRLHCGLYVGRVINRQLCELQVEGSAAFGLGQALFALAEGGGETRVLAGGTALVLMLKNRLVAPTALLSLHRLRDLRYIRHEPGTGLRIGALTTIREVETSLLVRQRNPVLAQTC